MHGKFKPFEHRVGSTGRMLMPALSSWRVLCSDKVLAGVYLFSLAGFWLSGYLLSYLNLYGMALMWAALLLLLTTGIAGIMLVGVPFVAAWRTKRSLATPGNAGFAVQVGFRLAFLAAGLFAASAFYSRAPDATLLGHLHRAAALSKPAAWQACAARLCLATHRDDSFSAGLPGEFLPQPEVVRFADNWAVWGIPEVEITVRDGGGKQVRFAWGGLSGRWGIVACPAGERPLSPSDGHIKDCLHWEGDLWIWTGD